MDSTRQYVRDLMISINRIDGLWYRLARMSKRKVNTLSILLALDDGKARTQAQIAEEWIIPKTTINTIVKECLDQDYITFTKKASQKEKLLTLTDKGKQYALESLQLFYLTENKAMTKTLSEFSPEFIKALNAYTNHLKEAIEAIV